MEDDGEGGGAVGRGSVGTIAAEAGEREGRHDGADGARGRDEATGAPGGWDFTRAHAETAVGGGALHGVGASGLSGGERDVLHGGGASEMPGETDALPGSGASELPGEGMGTLRGSS